MNFSVYLILDLVLICIVLGILLRCWKQGLVASLIRLVGTVAAYAGAWIVSKPIAVFLYESFAKKWLVGYAQGLIPPGMDALASDAAALGGLSGVSGRFAEMIAEALAELFAKMGLDGIPFIAADPQTLGNGIAGQVLDNGYSLSEAITETLLQPLATTLLRILAFAVVFWLLSLVVSVLFRIGVGVNHLPLVGGVNRLLGAGIGLVEAAITLYIICITLAMFSALFGSKIEFLRWDMLSQAKLFRFFVGLRMPGGFGMS